MGEQQTKRKPVAATAFPGEASKVLLPPPSGRAKREGLAVPTFYIYSREPYRTLKEDFAAYVRYAKEHSRLCRNEAIRRLLFVGLEVLKKEHPQIFGQ